MVTLIAGVERALGRDEIRAVVAAVAGGRAKQRRLALALAARPEILSDGRSPAPRAAGNLLIALARAGAADTSPPACAGCGRPLRTFQRRGDDWYCGPCAEEREPCAGCGQDRRVSSRDRAGRPRCGQCPDSDGRDPVGVIHGIVAALDPAAGREAVADAARRSAPRPAYQQKLAWALERNPALLTGDAHLSPLRAVPRFIEILHSAGVAGVVRPSCGHCGRTVRIDKPLNGVRGLPEVPRAVARAAVRALRGRPRSRHPGRPGPAALRELHDQRPGQPRGLRELRAPEAGEHAQPGRAALPFLPAAAGAGVLGLRPGPAMRDLPADRAAMVPACQSAGRRCASCGTRRPGRLGHPGGADVPTAAPSRVPGDCAGLRRQPAARASAPAACCELRLRELLGEPGGQRLPRARAR